MGHQPAERLDRLRRAPTAPPLPPRPGRRATDFERGLLQRLLRLMGDPDIRFELWDGRPVVSHGDADVGTVRLADRRALLRLLLDPQLQFGDLYAEGRLTVDGDLVTVMETGQRALQRTGRDAHRGWRPRHHNSRAGSRRNVHRHYDIGNDFYRRWLDRDAMQYTCAYFPRGGMTLEEAQAAKMHHICRKLDLHPGDTVFEVGCGWGGFALFMARHYGVRVRAFNISHEQILHARQQLWGSGLESRVEFIEDDYRNVHGRCDAFAAIGMLEHVGTRHYRDLGRVIDRCLSPEGRGLIHTIGHNREVAMNRWIERRIFPGAHPPTVRRLMDVFEPFGFEIQDLENLRRHYAETLRHWLSRFDAHEAEVIEEFDQRFARLWRLYLAGSVAAFETGGLQLFQVLFTRPGVRDRPRSRVALYRDG